MASNPISDDAGIAKQEENKTPIDHTDEGDAALDRACTIYDSEIRHLVEPERQGEYLTLDVVTGEYEIDADEAAATSRMLERHAAENLFTFRIGYLAFGAFGMRVRRVSEYQAGVASRRPSKTLVPAPGHENSVVSKGIAIYDAKIRHLVEPEHHGKYLALDVKTGEYDFDADSLAANSRMLERHSPENLVLLRIGYPAFGTFVGWRGVFS